MTTTPLLDTLAFLVKKAVTENNAEPKGILMHFITHTRLEQELAKTLSDLTIQQFRLPILKFHNIKIYRSYEIEEGKFKIFFQDVEG